ncbi:FAD-binding oxidoreductase [Lacisediminimonas sp.]|uniref:FAD-binding oxidoreductase n=1 Tax=Lacisediminimonas sp. TaxID=3060582 RepID=UPI00271C3648|nr:FAD-binding oxidoreductase [Lacisediminimonas sp.]MDO8301449.1 FAD-binding oxidoreductase [Lacisediminimonas sp.]
MPEWWAGQVQAGPLDEKYLHDWSGTRYGTPAGLARPASTQEVASLVADCQRARQALAVQGGRTGVSGGAAPGDSEVVLSLERLDQVEEFDRRAGIVVAGAGVILADLQTMVEAEGWMFPIDLGSRGSCQLGGNAATNAGGCRVVKYGNTRDVILGLEAVLADGSVIGPPNKLVKNNSGYSLSQLLVGSEGTLGIITRLALKLVPKPAARRSFLLALAPDAGLQTVLQRCKFGLGGALSAAEAMWPDFIEGVVAARGAGRALPASFAGRPALLVEVEGESHDVLARLTEDFASELMEQGLVLDAILPASERDAQQLWMLRESIPELQAPIRPYVGFDLGMDPAGYESFVLLAKAQLQKDLPAVKSYFFGHVGDGNLHALVGPCRSPEEMQLAEQALYRHLKPLETCVTAEHGVGRKKKSYLASSRSAPDIAAMKAIKHSLDPLGILNPGRIF